MLHNIFMKNVEILRKVLPVNSEYWYTWKILKSLNTIRKKQSKTILYTYLLAIRSIARLFSSKDTNYFPDMKLRNRVGIEGDN